MAENTVPMKALKSFGIVGVNEGKIKATREFNALNEGRARELEAAGLAARMDSKGEKSDSAHKNKAEGAAPKNKAAEDGPLGSPGGKTGAEKPVQSSRPAHQRYKRPYQRSKDD
jgi:hypothetical protein